MHCRWAQLPGIAEELRAGLAAEYNDMADGLVVGHPEEFAARRRVRGMPLHPVASGPSPRAVLVHRAASAVERDQQPEPGTERRCGVIRSGGCPPLGIYEQLFAALDARRQIGQIFLAIAECRSFHDSATLKRVRHLTHLA